MPLRQRDTTSQPVANMPDMIQASVVCGPMPQHDAAVGAIDVEDGMVHLRSRGQVGAQLTVKCGCGCLKGKHVQPTAVATGSLTVLQNFCQSRSFVNRPEASTHVSRAGPALAALGLACQDDNLLAGRPRLLRSFVLELWLSDSVANCLRLDSTACGRAAGLVQQRTHTTCAVRASWKGDRGAAGRQSTVLQRACGRHRQGT